jgi:ABC-type polysaccharide/polyol phosphate export permease
VVKLTTVTKPLYDSDKRTNLALTELGEMGRYRYLLRQLIRRDILTRYKRSVLGVAWTMLNPLGTMLILSLVFSNLFNAGGSYPVYILSGLLAWNFFAQGTNAAMSGLMWGSGLMKQIYVPRTIFGVSAIGTALVNQLLSLVPLMIVILTTRSPLFLTLLFLPVAIILLAFFTLGIGLILSTLSAYFPDVSEMYQILLTAWMYLTPIIYPETIIPENLLWAFRFNPMYHLVKMFRLSIFEGRLPSLAEFLPALGWGVGVLVIGWLFFTSKSDEYAYRI